MVLRLHEEVRSRRGRGRQPSPHPEGVVPRLRRAGQGGEAIALDEIGTEPQRTRRIPAALVVLALVLTVGVIAGNNVTEGRELDHVLARVVASQDAIAYSDRRVAATVEYTRPLLFGANVPANVRAGLQQLVADSAAGQVSDIEKERARAGEISLLPWHRGLRRAKAALVTYLGARVQYLRDVATNTQTLYVAHPELGTLLDDAHAALRDAAGGGAQKRVDAAFRAS